MVSLAIALSILRAERASGGAVGDFADGIHSRAGVLSASAFTQAATDHLQRAEQAPGGPVPFALISADIDLLPDFNLAFGRTAGDEAIASFAETLRRTVPPTALIGHPAAGRFLILAGVASPAESIAIAEDIQARLTDTPLPSADVIRLTASFSVADTLAHGFDLTTLMTAVTQAVNVVKTSGGNDIAVALTRP
nr:GGDEF domain-containing protein [Leifsonia psychrotolerans]